MLKQSPPEVVSMIAALTDHRDVDLLESSLLKTVADLFSPDWAVIYHLAADETPEFSVALREGAISRHPVAGSFSQQVSSAGVTAFPIMSQTRNVLGYLLVHREPALSMDEQKLMSALFRVYDNYLTVLKDSQIDRLTGLLNRHTFDAQLDRALGLIRRAYHEEQDSDTRQRKLGAAGYFYLGEIDIDHFKTVNDRFGHLYGDEVLLIVARILQNTFRKTDLIYRFGGEEFVVIVYVDDRSHAEMTFDRLRRSIENQSFPQVGKVTVSIGVTEIRDTSIPVELLGHADQALYHAKMNGRNRVCFYEKLLASHDIEAHHTSNDITLFSPGES